MPDDREPLGRIAHSTYRDWLAEQVRRVYHDEMQEVAWDDLTEGMREAYMRIGSAVAAEALRRHEAERTEWTLARLSRSVKLARIAAYIREKAKYDDGLKVVERDIRAIIGGEDGQPAPKEEP